MNDLWLPETAVGSRDLEMIIEQSKAVVRSGRRVLPTFYAYDRERTEYRIIGKWTTAEEKQGFFEFLVRYFAYKGIVGYVMVGDTSMSKPDHKTRRALLVSNISRKARKFVYIGYYQDQDRVVFDEPVVTENIIGVSVSLLRPVPKPSAATAVLLDELFERADGVITKRGTVH